MQNTEQNNTSDFMIERIKQRPLSKRKLFRRTMLTVSMAVIFGLVACVTILMLEPLLSNWLYPEEEPPVVTFQEEETEMSPEDMLTESMAEETPQPPRIPAAENALEEKDVETLLSSIKLDAQHYAQLYEALEDVVTELKQRMVTITARKKNVNWMASIYETSKKTMGVVIRNNTEELLILTDYASVKDADKLQVVFDSGIGVEAKLKKSHTTSDVAILSIDTSALGDLFSEIPVAEFGSSFVSDICTPVIAIGNPMGECGSVGYGMITSKSGQMTMVDANYKLITTDIYGSQDAKGFLFNLKGQLIGMITDKVNDIDMPNLISAYGISDLRRLIYNLSEGRGIAFMGITGIDVSETANTEGKVPLGVYVTNLNMNSPAMLAGIQRGDIIVGINGTEVTKYNDYFYALNDMESGQTVTLKIMRQMQNVYKEMEFEIVLQEAN